MTEQPSTKYPKHYASKFYVGRGIAQNINSGVFTAVQYDVTIFDVLQEYNTGVANAFQPLDAGYYFLNASAMMQALAIADLFGLMFYVNGGFEIAQQYKMCHAAVEDAYLNISAIYYLTPNDYVEVRVWHNFGAGRTTGGNQYRDHFCGFRMG